MKVKDLYIYPIKSCQGIKVLQSLVTEKGFLWDREFMLVNQQGIFLTQRDYPVLATVQISFVEDIIYLSTHQHQLSSLKFVPMEEGKEIKVRVWNDSTMAIDQGNEVAEWFNMLLQFTGKSYCRLVRQSKQYLRYIDNKYSFKKNQWVSFADGFPFLLTATASLDDLNHRLAKKYGNLSQEVPMNRFRPNIVIETNQPFIESTWERIKIGEVNFRLVKPCSRCIVTTTNQDTGERNPLKEPLVTLNSFRLLKNQGIMFGENMIPENLGIIKIDDFIEF